LLSSLSVATSLEDSTFIIQERFTGVGSGLCSQASVSTGIAIAETELPTIQFSIPNGDSTGSEILAGCPVDLFVNGQLTAISNGSGNPNVEILVLGGSTVRLRYPATGLEVRASVRNAASTFGCFFLVQVFLPLSYRPGETILGLLGKPNGRRNDDWVAPDGSSYSPPRNEQESIFSAAYDYCVSNWCIRDENDSIFSYRPDETFASISGCDENYSAEIEAAVANAGPDLVAICGSELFCLVDGVCGNLQDAQTALKDEILIETAQEDNPFSPSPSPVPHTRPPSRNPVPGSMNRSKSSKRGSKRGKGGSRSRT